MGVEGLLCCEVQALVATTNVRHAWDCHTEQPFRHWWALDQIWVRCGAEKAHLLPTLCGAPTLLNLCDFPMRCRWSLTVLSETWQRLASSPQVRLLSKSTAGFMASSSRNCGRGYCGIHTKGVNLNFWNQCVEMRSLTELPPKTWRIRRLDAAEDKHTLTF